MYMMWDKQLIIFPGTRYWRIVSMNVTDIEDRLKEAIENDVDYADGGIPRRCDRNGGNGMTSGQAFPALLS